MGFICNCIYTLHEIYISSDIFQLGQIATWKGKQTLSTQSYQSYLSGLWRETYTISSLLKLAKLFNN